MNRKTYICVAAGLLFSFQCAMCAFPTPQNLVEALRNNKNFSAAIKVLVTLPMAANDEVEYSISVASADAACDTLSAIDYIIDWTLPTPGGHSRGFTAYFDGHLYRYRDGTKLQEYHFDSNPEPFRSATPVQKTAQFLEILPVVVADEINGMLADSTYTIHWSPDTIYRGNPAAVLRARRTVNDVEVANLLYVFDKTLSTPLYIEKEMSPGTISEQTVACSYTVPAPISIGVPADEESLANAYPREFSLYREGTYALNSLKEKPLPGFSLPLSDGGRFSYARGEGLPSPSILVFLDETIGSTPETIEMVRKSIGMLPMNVDVKWIFLSNRNDDIERLFPTIPFGEQVVLSGRNVVKDFGITETPSFIFISRDGTVTDVMTGFNKELISSVINKAATLR